MPPHYGQGQDTEAVFECHFPGTSEDVRAQLLEVERFAADSAGCETGHGDLMIVLGEVLNNIVEHALADDSSDGAIHLRLDFAVDAIAVETRDRGRALPEGALPQGEAPSIDVERMDLPEGGFGWYLIHSLAQDLDYDRSEGQNTLRFNVPYSGN